MATDGSSPRHGPAPVIGLGSGRRRPPGMVAAMPWLPEPELDMAPSIPHREAADDRRSARGRQIVGAACVSTWSPVRILPMRRPALRPLRRWRSAWSQRWLPRGVSRSRPAAPSRAEGHDAPGVMAALGSALSGWIHPGAVVHPSKAPRHSFSFQWQMRVWSVVRDHSPGRCAPPLPAQHLGVEHVVGTSLLYDPPLAGASPGNASGLIRREALGHLQPGIRVATG